MLEYNKYIKNLIKRNEYPFNNKKYKKSIEDKIYYQTFEMDLTLSLILLSYFKSFKENANCYPMNFDSLEAWKKEIDKIIEGLEYYVKHGKDWSNSTKAKMASKKIKKTMRLIGKNFESFWW